MCHEAKNLHRVTKMFSYSEAFWNPDTITNDDDMLIPLAVLVAQSITRKHVIRCSRLKMIYDLIYTSPQTLLPPTSKNKTNVFKNIYHKF